MTPREQQLFDLGQNFPGLLTDEELTEWALLRDGLETEPTEAEQDLWRGALILLALFLALVAVLSGV